MAAGDLLIRANSTVTFGGATPDVPWTSIGGITDGQGAQSGQLDLGDPVAAARPNLFRIRFWVQCATTPPNLEQGFDIYLKTSDEANARSDNSLANGDLQMIAAGVEDKLRNLTFIGTAVVDEAAVAVEFVLSVPEVLINARYVNWVCWNASGGTVVAAGADVALEMTPIIYQGQSS